MEESEFKKLQKRVDELEKKVKKPKENGGDNFLQQNSGKSKVVRRDSVFKGILVIPLGKTTVNGKYKGQLIFQTSDNLVYVWTGSTWVALT